jgi:hypothetical protein
MSTLILKKPTPGDLLIPDVGIIIPGASQDAYADAATQQDLAGSENLRTVISAGTIVVNDGVVDLNIADGLVYLSTLGAMTGFNETPNLILIPIGFVWNADLTWLGVSQIQAGKAAKASRVRDSANIFTISWTGLLVGSMPADLEGGVEAANTWYAVYVIADSSGASPVKLLFSLSGAAPTLPVGYNRFRRIGWVRNNGASDFLKFLQTGTNQTRRYWWDEAASTVRALSDGAAVAFTPVLLDAFVPPAARQAELHVGFATGLLGVSGDGVSLRPTGSGVANPVWRVQGQVVSAIKTYDTFGMPVNGSQSIDYKVDNGANRADIEVCGFDDQL